MYAMELERLSALSAVVKARSEYGFCEKHFTGVGNFDIMSV